METGTGQAVPMEDPAVTSVRFLSAPVEGATPELELHGRLYLPADHSGRTRPGLVVGHGAESRAERHHDFCLVACRRGFVVLAFDFRGHGSSGGQGDGPLELDVLAAVRFLREHPDVDPDQIAYRGSSMGGFYGLRAAPQAGFRAMALLCPASARTMLRAVRRVQQEEAAIKIANQASTTKDKKAADSTRWDTPRMREYFESQVRRPVGREVQCPVLIVQARGDDTVPLAETLALAEELPVETMLLLLPGGSHTSAQHDPRVHSFTVGWLWEKTTEAK